ncbi:DNA polymerase IV [Gordonia sp. NPDC003424]
MAEPQRYRWLLHVDLDQFQVSVERLRSPELVGVAVIVGGNGDPTEARKVVTCASYEARDAGVRAGMPLRSAHRKLPDAVYLPLDIPAYDVASGEVMEVLRSFGHPVEVWGWDEAYLGIGPLPAPPTPVDTAPVDTAPDDATVVGIAADIRAEILARSGLACSIGISDNKQRAKMATGFAKKGVSGAELAADKVFLLDDRNWLDLMGDQPCRELWSVGPKTAAKLESAGVATVRDLIATPRDRLISIFGPHQGNWLYVLCRGGGDPSITEEPWLAKSHSKSRTFPVDLTDRVEMRSAAEQLTGEVLDQVLGEERVVFRVAVTVRTSTFFTRTKSRKLPGETTSRDDILPVVIALLDDFDVDRPVRLLGVRLDLVADDAELTEVDA